MRTGLTDWVINHKDYAAPEPIFKSIRKEPKIIFTESLIEKLLNSDLDRQKIILKNTFNVLKIKLLKEAAHEQPSSFSPFTKLVLEELCEFDDRLDTYEELAPNIGEELIPDTLPSPDTDPKRLTQS